MTERVVLYNSIADVPVGTKTFMGSKGRLYDSAQWLAYCERLTDNQMRYFCSFRQDETTGVLAVRIVPDSNVMPLYDPSALLSDPQAVRSEIFPSAVAAVSGTHCVLIVGDEYGQDSRATVEVLVTSVRDWAASNGIPSIAYMYLPRDKAEEIAGSAGISARSSLIDSQMILGGNWADFDGYVDTLKGSMRNKIRRERREFAAAGLRIRIERGTEVLNERTAELQLQLRHRYGIGGSIDRILTDYENLRSCVEDRVIVFLCEKGNDIVGLAIALMDEDRLHIRLAGFDYESVGPNFSYFNTAFYAPIEWGAAQGISEYVFGTENYKAKMSRGCRPKGLYGVFLWPASVDRIASKDLLKREEGFATSLVEVRSDNQ